MAMTDRAVNNQRYESLKLMLEERRQEIVDKLRTIREAMPDQRDNDEFARVIPFS